ncbi:hypothetical protein BDZ91DRAFT_270313 [Kalaharituber pfeilii]|nr:hypothetical protein BDZ91DRAFT_270313 [Kalaharituber pfeilii]
MSSLRPALSEIPLPLSASRRTTRRRSRRNRSSALLGNSTFFETIFLHEPSDDSPGEDKIVRVDIFATEQELPFAGHPTIGAGYYLLHVRAGSYNKTRPLGLQILAG